MKVSIKLEDSDKQMIAEAVNNLLDLVITKDPNNRDDLVNMIQDHIKSLLTKLELEPIIQSTVNEIFDVVQNEFYSQYNEKVLTIDKSVRKMMKRD